MKYQNTELCVSSFKSVALLKRASVMYEGKKVAAAGINLYLSLFLSPGPFKGSYDLERGLCDLERLDRPTEAGWDGIPGVR